jgi:hypothetical protein
MIDIIKRNGGYKFERMNKYFDFKSLVVVSIALLIGTSTLTIQQGVIGKSYESSGDRIDGTLDSRALSPEKSGKVEPGPIVQNDTNENREIISPEIGTNRVNDQRKTPLEDGNPSVMTLGGDFTTQAALLGPATFRSTDLVSSTAIYEIQFFTTTTAVIDKIDITFPAGTGVAFASILERTGITGPATVTKSGTTVTLDLNTPVNVPAGTLVRFEMVDLINPPNPANYKISVTTKTQSNVPIDGPSLSPAYTIRQVSTGMIANGAVTKDKINSSFMTSRILEDNSIGNSFGWDPDGLETNFIIIDDVAITSANPVLVNVGDSGTNSQCEALGALTGFFTIECLSPPPQGSELRYTVANLGLT